MKRAPSSPPEPVEPAWKTPEELAAAVDEAAVIASVAGAPPTTTVRVLVRSPLSYVEIALPVEAVSAHAKTLYVPTAFGVNVAVATVTLVCESNEAAADPTWKLDWRTVPAPAT